MCDPALMEPCIILMLVGNWIGYMYTLFKMLYLFLQYPVEMCAFQRAREREREMRVTTALWSIASLAVFTCAGILHGGLWL